MKKRDRKGEEIDYKQADDQLRITLKKIQDQADLIDTLDLEINKMLISLAKMPSESKSEIRELKMDIQEKLDILKKEEIKYGNLMKGDLVQHTYQSRSAYAKAFYNSTQQVPEDKYSMFFCIFQPTLKIRYHKYFSKKCPLYYTWYITCY